MAKVILAFGFDKVRVFLLQEYVIVLLKNGRRKVEAKKELNVFLGDDSDCFVSCYWNCVNI